MSNHNQNKDFYISLAISQPTIKKIPHDLRSVKRWLKAKSRDNHQPEKLRNIVIERSYHSVLKAAKEISGRPTMPVFERNFLYDNTESATAMHAYLDSSFYFTLDCDWLYQYQVEYAFNECKNHHKLTELISNCPFGRHATEKELKPSFHDFYCNVLKAQHPKYITIY